MHVTGSLGGEGSGAVAFSFNLSMLALMLSFLLTVLVNPFSRARSQSLVISFLGEASDETRVR